LRNNKLFYSAAGLFRRILLLPILHREAEKEEDYYRQYKTTLFQVDSSEVDRANRLVFQELV